MPTNCRIWLYQIRAASLRSAADIEEVGVQDHLGPQDAAGQTPSVADRAFFGTRKR
jgi:hypothetical protein